MKISCTWVFSMLLLFCSALFIRDGQTASMKKMIKGETLKVEGQPAGHRQHQQGNHRPLLVLKLARTGSTWLVLELNKLQGVHVTQETFLNWERDWKSSLGYNSKEGELLPDQLSLNNFMGVTSRTAWLRESLLRPMPKNPFSRLVCLSPQRRWAQEKLVECNNTTNRWLEPLNYTEVIAPLGLPKQLLVCKPPYSQDSPSCEDDERSCFSQASEQPICFRAAPDSMNVIGLSTNFMSTMKHQNGSKLSQHELTNVYADMKSMIGEALFVVGQVRGNFVRHSMSQSFHFKSAQQVHLSIRHVIRTAQKNMDVLNMVYTIDKKAHMVTYEEMGIDINGVVAKIRGNRERDTASVDWQGGTNTKEKNDTLSSISHKISNFDSIKEEFQKYPCFLAQLLSTNKYARWSLPGHFDQKLGRFVLNPKSPCCVLQKNVELVRRVEDVFLSGTDQCQH